MSAEAKIREALVEELDTAAERLTRYTNNPLDGLLTAAARMIEELGAEVEGLRADAVRLRNAGGQMSNCAFNLAQRDPGEFAARDAGALDTARKDWDAAVRALSGPKGQGSGDLTRGGGE